MISRSDKLHETSNGGSAASGTCPKMIIDIRQRDNKFANKPGGGYGIEPCEGLMLKLQIKVQIPQPSSTSKRITVITSSPWAPKAEDAAARHLDSGLHGRPSCVREYSCPFLPCTVQAAASYV
jgi:hypothetical protein